MRDLDFTSLRLFVAVCDSGSMSRAAEQSSLVASAVSKRLASLEAQWGAPLLQRKRHGVVPTEAGQILLQHARSMLLSAQRIERDMGGHAAGIRGRVNVLATASALAEFLADDIAAFLQVPEYRHIRVDLEERFSSAVVQGVREGEGDLGVLWDHTDTGPLAWAPYREDHLCVAVPRGHPLARRRALRFADTLAYEMVTLPVHAAMTVLLLQQAQALGQVLQQRVIVTNLDSKLRVVRAGLGIAILPREIVQQMGAGQLVAVPLEEPWAARRFVLCHRTPEPDSPSARLLLQYLSRRSAAPRPAS